MGRTAELERLAVAFDAARSGQPSVVLVAGEAGIGKSRLVAEAAGRARGSGVRVLEGGAIALGAESLPYGPIAEILRGLARAQPADDLAALPASSRAVLGRLAPELLPATGQRSGEPPPESYAQGSLFEAFLVLLRQIANRVPLLVVIEDVHWADRSTLELLSFLVRNLREGTITLLVTYRSDELHRRHPLLPFLAELERSTRVERIQVARFDRTEVTAQIEGITGTRPEPDLVERVYGRSEGNPFYAEELLAARASNLYLPDTLREVLLARVASLSEPTQGLLRVASAAGSRISRTLLSGVARLNDDALDAALREAIDRQVLLPLDGAVDEQYAFRHALVREAVYGDLLAGERTRLHAAFARAMVERPPPETDASWTAELAYHFQAAHNLPSAFEAWISAGIEAEAIYAFDEARASFERALDLWDEVPDALARAPFDQVDLLVRAAFLEQGASPARAVAYTRAAIALVDPEIDPTRAGILYEQLGQYLATLLDGGDPLAAYREAVRLVPEQPPSRARVQVVAGLGRYLTAIFKFDEAAAASREALSMAQAIGTRDLEGQILGTLGTDLVELGEVEAGLTMMVRSVQLARDTGDVHGVARAMAWLAGGLCEAGRYEDAAAAGLQADVYAVDHGLAARWATVGLYWAGDALIALGRWEEASAVLLRAERYDPAGITELAIEERLLLLEALRGEFTSTAGRASRVRLLTERVPRADLPNLGLVAFIAAAELGLWQGNARAAEAAIRQATTVVEATSAVDVARVGWLFALGLRAEAELALEAAARHSDRERQESLTATVGLLTRARALATEVASDRPYYADHAAAWLATCEAEASRAAGLPEPAPWALASAAWHAMGQPYHEAYSLMREGEAALAGRDRHRAADALDSARAIAGRLGAVPLLQQIDDLARRAGIHLGRPIRTSSTGDRCLGTAGRARRRPEAPSHQSGCHADGTT